MEKPNIDSSQVIDEKPMPRRKLLASMVALGLGGASLTKTTPAYAGVQTAAAVTALESFMKVAADEATNLAKDIYKNQIESWKRLTGVKTDSVTEQGSLNRTTMAALADAAKKDKDERENARITTANQAPPTACTSDTALMLLFNRYPAVNKLTATNTYIDFASILENSWESAGDAALSKLRPPKEEVKETKRNVVKENRESHPKDEHLKGGLVLKNGTYTKDEEKQVASNIRTQSVRYKGKVSPVSDAMQSTDAGVEYELKRSFIKQAYAQAQQVKVDAFEKRKGSDQDLKALRKSVENLQGSKDSRDEDYSKGLKKLIKILDDEGGSRVSVYGLEKFQIEQRLLPEYDQYLFKLGGEPVPFLKELIFIGRESLKSKFDELREVERTNLLLANLLQLELDGVVDSLSEKHGNLMSGEG